MGFTETSQYDLGQQLMNRTETDGTTVMRYAVRYDWQNRPLITKRYDTGSGVYYDVLRAYTYAGDGTLKELTQANAASSVVADYQMAYDGLAEVTEKIDHGVTQFYSYDRSGQLSRVVRGGTTTTYGYDADGQLRNNNGSTPGTNNRLANNGTWTYGYDYEGNVLSKNDGTNLWQYAYDNANHVTRVYYGPVGSPGTVAAEYDYAPFGSA